MPNYVTMPTSELLNWAEMEMLSKGVLNGDLQEAVVKRLADLAFTFEDYCEAADEVESQKVEIEGMKALLKEAEEEIDKLRKEVSTEKQP